MENKQQQHHKKHISRSQPSSPLIDPTDRLGRSPLRGSSHKPFVPEPARKSVQANDETRLRGRWPSSSSSSKKSCNSLGDCLVNDGLSELSCRKGNTDSSKSLSSATSGPQSLSRMRSCSQFNHLEEGIKKDDEEEEQIGRKMSKENRPFGNSMRYIGKLKFPKSSSNPQSVQPGRMSVDENTLTIRRKATDFGVEIPSSESDRSGSTKGTSPKVSRAQDVVPIAKFAATTAAIRRTSSGNVKGMSQWALSPGRRSNSPPPSLPVAENDGGGTPSRSFSNLRPASPDRKHKKVGNIISIGLDLFRRKSGSGSMSNKLRPSSPVSLNGDMGYQLIMLHNCLIRWRYVNARSDGVNRIRKNIAENALVSTWVEIARLQATVMQKMVQLEREKLDLKLNRLLSWQLKSLEGWGDIEKQHTLNLSTAQNCLQAAVCRLPLVDRAKADSQILSIRLRQATNLTAAITTTLGPYASAAQDTAPSLTELAMLVAEEKTLLDECLDMLGQFCTLQIQEESLRCHLVQLKSSQEQSIVSPKEVM